ncbi:MAG: flavodoxin family protein [Oscillospiraceae bacterium]|nr:flavodoxin family protein [Oscillospiraceae bacterium]
MKVIAINGSPRRNWNTAKLCQAALEGAAAAGAETELIHLESMTFKGCISCYRCHSVREYNTEVCYYKDQLSETLEKCMKADAIIIGSPVYYGFTTGDVRAFMERLMFPIDTYEVDAEGRRPIKLNRIIPTAMIYTMNAPGLPPENALTMNESELRRMFGYSESHYAYDTCQFTDYSRYAANLFGAEHKRKRLEEQFPVELEQCRELGARLVQKAQEARDGTLRREEIILPKELLDAIRG